MNVGIKNSDKLSEYVEKELVLEIDRMKRKRGGVQASAKRGRSPNRFDQFIKNVEQERDYWKNEVDTLQQVLKWVCKIPHFLLTVDMVKRWRYKETFSPDTGESVNQRGVLHSPRSLKGHGLGVQASNQWGSRDWSQRWKRRRRRETTTRGSLNCRFVPQPIVSVSAAVASWWRWLCHCRSHWGHDLHVILLRPTCQCLVTPASCVASFASVTSYRRS